MMPANSGVTDATIRATWLALPLQFFAGGSVLGVFTSITLFVSAFSAEDDYESLP